MQRMIVLDGHSNKDRAHFRILIDAFMQRPQPNPNDRRVQSPEDRRSERRLKHVLMTASETDYRVKGEPVGEWSETVDAAEFMKPREENEYLDRRPRRLRAGKQKIVLDQADWSRLVKLVADNDWQPHAVDVAADVEDRLDAAEKIEPSADQKVTSMRKRQPGQL